MSAAFYILLLKTLAALSWASSQSGPEAVREFSEHLLAVPDAKKVLNSVLGRLEHNRQAQAQRFDHGTEYDEILPEYTETIQSGRERDLGQVVGRKHFAICNLKRKIRRLNTIEYEYRPAYYEEVFCVSSGEEDGATNEVCSGLGLSCVQWNKTMHLTRRRYTSWYIIGEIVATGIVPTTVDYREIDCWETRTLVIPAGCECLWPAHKLGDMSLHV